MKPTVETAKELFQSERARVAAEKAAAEAPPPAVPLRASIVTPLVLWVTPSNTPPVEVTVPLDTGATIDTEQGFDDFGAL